MSTPNPDSTDVNLTARWLPKAPYIINHHNTLVSASDYWREQVRKVMKTMGLNEESINQVMSARTIAKLWHWYKEVTLRRSWERYIDHTNWVFLLLLLEFWIVDSELLSASHLHDFKEDVKIDFREMENMIKRATSEWTYHIMDMVTNPLKTWNSEHDYANKVRHYSIMGTDIRACLLKTADRCYNLRSLEIMNLNPDLITDSQIDWAKKQVLESREFILPLAEKCWKDIILLKDIENVEKRISELSLKRLQNSVKGHVPTGGPN